MITYIHRMKEGLTKTRILIALVLGYTTLIAAFASSIFSTATSVISKVFHVSTEVGTLGLSLYVLGFATGPILWYAQLSMCRRPVFANVYQGAS